MEKAFIVFLLIAPLVIFFTSFVIARQFRPFENAPVISQLFVQRKLPYSIVTGFIISVFFTFLYSVTLEFSLNKIIAFVILFVLVSGSSFFGMKFGWGNTLSVNVINKSIDAPTSQLRPDSDFPENIIFKNSLAAVKITINSRKRWTFFTMEAFQWIIMGLCFLPIAGYAAISFLQYYIPEDFRFLVWLLVAGLVLYILYIKFMEALEFVFDKEIVEIDNLSVRIEKYGLRFNSKKEYPAENIKKITGMFSFGGTNTVIKRSSSINSNMPAFVLWHNRGLKRYRTFGRAIDLADAQNILEIIYAKFPQYKG